MFVTVAADVVPEEVPDIGCQTASVRVGDTDDISLHRARDLFGKLDMLRIECDKCSRRLIDV
jgi:hypothetical protein